VKAFFLFDHHDFVKMISVDQIEMKRKRGWVIHFLLFPKLCTL